MKKKSLNTYLFGSREIERKTSDLDREQREEEISGMDAGKCVSCDGEWPVRHLNGGGGLCSTKNT